MRNLLTRLCYVRVKTINKSDYYVRITIHHNKLVIIVNTETNEITYSYVAPVERIENERKLKDLETDFNDFQYDVSRIKAKFPPKSE